MATLTMTWRRVERPNVPFVGSRERVVMGIDPGTATTGYGIVVQTPNGEMALLACGVIRTAPEQPMHHRLLEIFEDIQALIDEFHPGAVAVEELFFGRNVTTALKVGQARGAVLVAAANRNVHVVEYTPAVVKQAITGYGGADKVQVQRMVKEILHLDEVPRPDDAADGVAIAICHLQSVNYQTLLNE